MIGSVDKKVCAVLLLNFVCSVCIVFFNKWLYAKMDFPNLTLTLLHFVCTSLGLFVCKQLKLFEVKRIPLMQILPLAVTFCGFVVFTNLSLQNNTVGTYQMGKLLTTPVLIIIQSNFYNVSFSGRIKFSLIPISIGIFINSYYDIKFNVVGTVFALTGVIVTSIYQVLVKNKQKDLEANSMQLLYYQAPMSSLMLLCLVPMLEPVFTEGGVFGGGLTAGALTLALTTGLIAVLINITIFWIIANTSPVTYNIFGNFKFCSTIIGGVVIFHDPIHAYQFLGILITLSGVALYTHEKLRPKPAEEKSNVEEPEETIKNKNVV
nr:solute carrier family 35 member E3-like [Ciona intestinalis]|eukprot:XP_002125793.1 solute carrier family 35 member E3-like [Ciona intestinalis]